MQLYQEREDILEKYTTRYEYVHIDEFQDTNIAQYVLGKQWASHSRNICVVGDPDQSIYTWRAADIRNILNFEHDFPEARVVILDQNYRSTQTILDSAHSVIALNKQRKEKNLWTENGAGEPIVVHEAYDEEDEAAFVAEEIRRLVREEKLRHQDIAVMYRTNAQSRPMEEALVRRSIPYRLVGGTRFYERREVKDLLAYLRLIQNPFDAVALMRVINVPHRGHRRPHAGRAEPLGAREGHPAVRGAAGRRRDGARLTGRAADQRAPVPEADGRRAAALPRHAERADRDVASTSTLSDLLDAVIDRTDYKPHIMADEDGEERWENVQELRAVTIQYDELKPEHALASFLEDVALITDVDTMEESDSVTLITLHAAKGLEFPVVFIIGLEEGILPHMRSFESGNPEQLEEERRLCYVGMTRAKQHLYLVRAFRRAFSGHNPPSRFLSDIPPQLVAHTQRASQREMFGPARYRVALPREERTTRPIVPGDSFKPATTCATSASARAWSSRASLPAATTRSWWRSRARPAIKKLLLSFAPLEKIA